MLACLAPNGQNVFRGSGPCTRLIVGTLKGLTILERDGGSWSAKGKALEGQHISSMAYEPKHRGLFAGVHEGGVHFSSDEGLSWQPRGRGITINHVFSLAYAEPPSGAVIYAGTEPAALFKSHDQGQSWQELPALRGAQLHHRGRAVLGGVLPWGRIGTPIQDAFGSAPRGPKRAGSKPESDS